MRDKEMDDIWNNRQYIFMIPNKVAFDNRLTIDDLRIYMLIRSFMYESPIAIMNIYNMLINVILIHKTTFKNCVKRLIENDYIEEEEKDRKICLKIKFK